MLREEMERIVTQHIRDRESRTKGQVKQTNSVYGVKCVCVWGGGGCDGVVRLCKTMIWMIFLLVCFQLVVHYLKISMSANHFQLQAASI